MDGKIWHEALRRLQETPTISKPAGPIPQRGNQMSGQSSFVDVTLGIVAGLFLFFVAGPLLLCFGCLLVGAGVVGSTVPLPEDPAAVQQQLDDSPQSGKSALQSGDASLQ